MIQRLGSVFLGLLLICCSLLCQAALIRFETLEAEHGLSMNTVNDLLTDEQGYLWVATQAGLNRFDGSHFRVYSQSDAPYGPSANNISQLYLSHRGQLWLVTENNDINLYHPQTDTFEVFGKAQGLPGIRITAINEDAAGMLWLATAGDGIYVFSPESGKVVRHVRQEDGSGLASNHIHLLFSDKYQRLWLVAESGLQLYQSEQQKFLSFDELKYHKISAIEDGDNNDLWLGTQDMGLWHFDIDTHVLTSFHQHFPKQNETVPISSIKRDRQDNLWVALQGSGLLQLDAKRQLTGWYRHSPSQYQSLVSQNLTKLWLDDENQLWIGTRNSGLSKTYLGAAALNRVDPQSFTDNNLPNADVRSIYRDRLGQLWIGTTAGLYRALESRPGVITGFREHGLADSTLNQAFIGFLREDSEGRLWIGTRGQGLFILNADRGQLKHYLHNSEDPGSLPSDSLYSCFVDRQGQFWLTTLDGGIGRYQPESDSFDSISGAQLPDDQVLGMVQDGQGRYWLTTYGGGLAMLAADGTIAHYNTTSIPALPSNYLFSIFITADDLLWVASDSGVFSLDSRTLYLQHYNQSSGLAGDIAYLLQLDPQQKLWIGTGTGLSVMDLNDGSIHSFGEEDGLQDNEFNFGASYIDSDGSIYLGGINGFNRMNFSSLPKLGSPRAPIIDQLELMNRPLRLSQHPKYPQDTDISAAKSISLGYEDTQFALHFHTPSLHRAKQLKYEYRMLGLNDTWIVDSSDQKAVFTGLAPGKYRFEVRARDLNGHLSPTTPLDLAVIPPPWQTWWAYSFYLLAFLSLLALVSLIRIRKYQQKMQMLEQIATSEQRLKQALWSSGDEFWDWEIAQKRLTRSNTFLGYPEKEINLQQTIEAVIHPDNIEAAKEAMSACLYQGKDEFEVSYQGKTPDGGWQWVMNHGKVISRDEQGRPNRIMGTIKNIQPLKETEAALRQLNLELEDRVRQRTRALQQSNDELNATLEELRLTRDELLDKEKMATLGGLVASITHEVNTPIGISVTAASHLQDRVREFNRAYEEGEVAHEDFQQYQGEVAECCRLMLTNLERAAKLIHSFKQVSVDQSHEELRDFDLALYLDEIFLSLNPMLSRTPHEYTYSCPQKLIINSNPGIFYQIISNLFNNSIIHAYPDKRHGKLALRISVDEQGLHLNYCDDGCGMEPEIAEQIFNPFFTTKRGRGGSGLGMNIVYNLVNQVLGGTIRIETAPSKGACFTIDLPASIIKSATAQPTPAS
ncbi:PAS domain-containing protein [Shewanella cyperi]|uniref:histidine kinase n=1 Tax=Shewanella cyperi TaxID=2814292 RepID=A0A974XPB9_9GAMM|nr:two-component regulator propeller domain-containing protein [Shewanella cyperi]QSX30923.1 PAS domain-containing protein [Shewanella cyperi]